MAVQCGTVQPISIVYSMWVSWSSQSVYCAADLYAHVQVNMSSHSGINFRGLVYLIDEATRPKAAQQAAAEQQTQQMQATA